MKTVYQTDENGVLVGQYDLTDDDLIPYRCVVVAPGPVSAGTVPVWVSEVNPLSSADFGLPGTGRWEVVPDYRGLSLYSIEDASEYIGDYNGLGPIPDGYTSNPRPDNSHVWKDGQWQLDLELVKLQKREAIKNWRDQQEDGTYIFEYDGHRWDYGKVSQSRLAPVVEVAKAGMLPPRFFWTDADNNDVPMNADSVTALDRAMTQALVLKGFQIHARQRQMKEELKAHTSAEQILAYKVGWPE